jgi:serine protease Do
MNERRRHSGGLVLITGCRGLVVGLALLSATSSGLPRSLAADAVPQPVLDAQQQRIEAIAKATRSAVAVFARGGQGGGSGVVITPDGYALTNFHVSKPSGDHMQCSMADGNLYDAVIVGIDPTGDVALIKLLGRDDFPPAVLADSDEVRVGDWCFAVGNPFLLATDFQPTVTYGIVSGVHRYQYPAGTLLEYADCIQTDASINPGNSGGPLFNANGDLIGINGRGSFEKRGRVNVGVGYAISINQIKNFMGYLRSGRIVDHATLGATVASDEAGRVVVTNILDESDAYRRGLRYGDEILAFGGRTITTVNGFKNALGIFPKGWRVPLSFRRGDQRRDVYVRLMGVHTADELLAKVAGRPEESPEGQPKPQRKPLPKPAPKEEGKPGGEPPQPKPIPLPNAPLAPVATPEHVAKFIKSRKGYANYYFNEWNRDRLWSAFVANGDFAALKGNWRLAGASEDGSKVEITLSDSQNSGQFPGEFVVLDPAKDLSEQLGPQGSGGLLVALHLWRRLLTLGPQQFGEVYYLGTCPLVDRPGLYDVLVTTHNVVETRFYFDPTSGRLAAIEMYSDNDRDPCEVYLDDYRAGEGGRQVPHLLHVRFGDRIYANLKLDSIELNTVASNAT